MGDGENDKQADSAGPGTPDAPTKRPWFQFSLATAIVMMLVAGGLIGANFTPRPGAVTQADFPSVTRFGYGWPVIADIRVRYDGNDDRVKANPNGREVAYFFEKERTGGSIYGQTRIDPWSAAADFVFGLGVLIVTAFLCEWFIRRRERGR
jgi:hypothetical protein